MLVSGADGFTGRYVCRELQRRGITCIALLRPGRDAGWMERHGLPVRRADLNDSAALAEALQGCRALLNVASIGFGAAPAILEACRRAGVRRAVFVSTTAIFTRLAAPSKRLRQEAEAAIRASGLDTTILRPTMIYGSPADRNMIRLVRWLARCPLLPVVGDGRSLQQPVLVRDVAWAIVAVLDRPETHGQAYNLSGAAPLTYNAVVVATAAALGRRPLLLHLPLAPCVALLRLAERLRLRLPLRAEQLQRLNEPKAFDHTPAREVFGYSPVGFPEGIAREVALWRLGPDWTREAWR
ncbi:MAG: NAD-dependent epimerase/dehydratase family protein [Synechococcaceae cyanobacterium]|nr:NAD-dependent epimerase/dehydratase family protein [Synechococcaceae cyanobacterium]